MIFNYFDVDDSLEIASYFFISGHESQNLLRSHNIRHGNSGVSGCYAILLKSEPTNVVDNDINNDPLSKIIHQNRQSFFIIQT